MGYMNAQILHLSYRVSRAMEATLARIYWRCCRIKFYSIWISLIPGIITCNISLRAGGPGQIYYYFKSFFNLIENNWSSE